MPFDYHYDFKSERKISNWRILHEDEECFKITAELDSEGGNVLFLFPASGTSFYAATTPRIVRLTVNGQFYDASKASPAYIGYACSRMGLKITLRYGKNELIAEGTKESEYSQDSFQSFSLIEAQRKVVVPSVWKSCITVPKKNSSVNIRKIDIANFTPGIGCKTTPGRFGFSKGNGLSDCGMPTLGNIDKMYLCGHPKYRKPFRWNYSTLPEGASRHGSFSTAEHGIEDDKIEINHLGFRWAAKFGAVDYVCTGSLASPGVISECSSGVMRLSDLEYAGNYQYMMIPRLDGRLEISTLRDVKDLTMGENFLLLFGCTEFPDIPLLLVFQSQPEGLEFQFDQRTNRLSEIRFHHCELMITATPFGLESFEPIPPDDEDYLRRASARCRFWSRALLAYPIRCEEYFRNDETAKKTTVVQKFSYRMIEDEWGTEALKLAPLPPMTSLCGMLESVDTEDFAFPTKYGYLRGAYGEMSSYTLPYMPSARKFPLRDTTNTALNELLKNGLQSYFDFEAHFPETTQSYPFAGALMEPYAFATTLMNFMDESDREYLRKLAGERLKEACKPLRTYDYPVIDHGEFMQNMPDDEAVLKIYGNPEMAYCKLWNWYERTEPFTGVKYHICYLNLGYFSSGRIKQGTPEEIAAFKIPLTENDWGAGLTFYYMYLCALASGDFSPVQENWPLLNSVYSFFEKMHDWACLSSGVMENGYSWVEGANYGLYTPFVNMARALGDGEAYGRAQYMAAKQFALRMSVLRSAKHYFCKYYNVEPWFIIKHFLDESNPEAQHQGVPKAQELDAQRLWKHSGYSFTTEGLYPEIFDAMRDFQAEDATSFMKKLQNMLRNMPKNVSNDWGQTHKTATLLIYMALNPDCNSQTLKEEIEFARKNLSLMARWRGIHIFSRRLPENYLETQLLAWDAMKKHPLWLEHWQDARIESAEWNGHEAVVTFCSGKFPLIRFGFRDKPERITLNGEDIPGVFPDAHTLEIRPCHTGKLVLLYPKIEIPT